MDILEPKQKGEYNYDLIKIINKLKFDNSPIEFKGSSSLKSQLFFSDYDLFSNITNDYTPEEVYKRFKEILEEIKKDNLLYFMELKIQSKEGKKTRFYKINDFEKKEDKFIKGFKDVDFVKIDLITFIKNYFMELSIIYKFSDEVMTEKEYLKSIKEDIKDLKKEGNYYKVLKRLFNFYKIKDDKEKLIYLSEIFNSDLGMIYQKKSNLEAMDKLIKSYKDELTRKRVELNLKDIKEPLNLNMIKRNVKRFGEVLNEEAEEIYKELT